MPSIIDSYLKTLQESSFPSSIKLGNDTFKSQWGIDENEKMPKIVLNKLQELNRNYYKIYKKKVIDYLNGKHDPHDYNFTKIDGVKSLKGSIFRIEPRGQSVYFELYWEMIPYGIVTNKKNQKVKIKLIGMENQGRSLVVYPVLPRGFYS